MADASPFHFHATFYDPKRLKLGVDTTFEPSGKAAHMIRIRVVEFTDAEYREFKSEAAVVIPIETARKLRDLLTRALGEQEGPG